MIHRPKVDLISGVVDLLSPNCICGWRGVNVIKYSIKLNTFLNSSEKYVTGGYSAATLQLKRHVKDFSNNREFQKIRNL